MAVGLLGGPVAVDCWACGRRIAGPVAVEGNVDGTKIVWAQMATIENKSAYILAVCTFETPLQTDISKIMAANKIVATNNWRDMYIANVAPLLTKRFAYQRDTTTPTTTTTTSTTTRTTHTRN